MMSAETAADAALRTNPVMPAAVLSAIDERREIASGFGLRYWPFLDGIRGLSVLAVIAVHTKLSFAPSGYFGVDIFFVLSGFLITLLLVEEWKQYGTIRLRDFYIRRALRLVPALVSVVAITTVWTAVAKPEKLEPVIRCAVAALTYITNWAWSYNWIELTPLTHTWSLALEEQFYLIWPFVLLLLLRQKWTNLARVVAVFIAIAAAIALRTGMVLWLGLSMRAYVGIDTRADSLLFGCAAALLVTWGLVPRRLVIEHVVRVGSVVAVVFLVYMIGTRHAAEPYVLYGIASVAVAVAWILFSFFYVPVRTMQLALSFPPLVWLGKRSYGIYLWHFPFVVLPLPLRVPPIFAAALSIGAAAISFAVIERPFLRMKRQRTVLAPHDRLA